MSTSLTEGLIVDKAAPCTSAHDETNVRHHVLQKFPTLSIRHKVGGSCDNAGDVRTRHRVQSVQRNGVYKACVDGEDEARP